MYTEGRIKKIPNNLDNICNEITLILWKDDGTLLPVYLIFFIAVEIMSALIFSGANFTDFNFVDLGFGVHLGFKKARAPKQVLLIRIPKFSLLSLCFSLVYLFWGYSEGRLFTLV